jgi:hypothetical protein
MKNKLVLGVVIGAFLVGGGLYAADLTSAQRNYIKAALPNTELADRVSDTLDKSSAMIGSLTFTVAAETSSPSNIITVSGQAKSVRGADMAVRSSFTCFLSGDANGDTILASHEGFVADYNSPDGIVAITGTGARLVVTESDGDFDINVKETSTTDYYLCCVLPNSLTSCSGILDFN